MKKNKVNKIVTLSIIGVLVVVAVTIFILNFTKDSSSFSLLEKKWISDNINNVIDVSVYNDIPVFGENGNGVIFDYLDYNDYKNTWQVKDLNPNDFEGNLDDLNIVPYDFYMDTTLPDGDGGLIFTKDQVDKLDTLLADYTKNNQTGKTRKLEL